MNLAFSFSGFMADVPIPCLALNLLFMKGVPKGPKYSYMLHIYLHRGTMTFGDRTDFRKKKFSSMTVLWIRTSNSSQGPHSKLPTLNIRIIWGELESAHRCASSHCARKHSGPSGREESRLVITYHGVPFNIGLYFFSTFCQCYSLLSPMETLPSVLALEK